MTDVKMDPLAHATISALVALRKTRVSRALAPWIIFGILPDIYLLAAIALSLVGLKAEVFDEWFALQYNVTHSLMVWGIVWLWLCLGLRQLYWPFAMYGLHIVTDMISHQHYLTPWLWPVSGFKVSGVFEYSDPRALLVTYAILIPIWAFIVINRLARADRV